MILIRRCRRRHCRRTVTLTDIMNTSTLIVMIVVCFVLCLLQCSVVVVGGGGFWR